MQSNSIGSYTLITGRFESGTQEQKNSIADILGTDQVLQKYRVYFYWYNVIHELGHAILHFNQHKEMSDVEEEPVVNDFAVAYWSYYGEEQKLAALQEIVRDSLARTCRPAPAGMDHMAYARENWGKEDFFNFNNYGWFQFSCVQDSLRNHKPILQHLQAMSTNVITTQPRATLRYDIDDDDMPFKIVKDATNILRKWGVTLPVLPHCIVDNPYRHGISTVGY
jgi:hypothetical protein